MIMILHNNNITTKTKTGRMECSRKMFFSFFVVDHTRV